jgi:hypothetical protein
MASARIIRIKEERRKDEVGRMKDEVGRRRADG